MGLIVANDCPVTSRPWGVIDLGGSELYIYIRHFKVAESEFAV